MDEFSGKSLGYLYKPFGEHTNRPLVMLPDQYQGQIHSVNLVDGNGNVTTPGRPRGPGRNIYDFPGWSGSNVQVRLNNGQTLTYPGGGTRRVGNAGQAIVHPTVSGGSGDSGSDSMTTNNNAFVSPENPSGASTSGVAALPFAPPDFPAFPTTAFPSIETAPYNFTDYTPTKYQPLDVQDFAKTFGSFNTGQVKQNFGQAQDLALSSLDTELQGLKHFAPAASALSRETMSVDNAYNQASRTQQVNAALPGAAQTYSRLGQTLQSQAGRAGSYASGRLPDQMLDASRELALRSRAADNAAYAGIGPRSGAATNLSDLMSADARFQIGQYGESLTGQNVGQQENLIGQRASLFLAPTEYSSAGSQIKPTPEVGAGRLTYQGLGVLNEASLVPPATALSADIQQRQFGTQSDIQQGEFATSNMTQQQQFATSLEQRTREFNATGEFSAGTFNSQGMFQSAVGQYAGQTQYLSGIQAANQANLNAASGINFQGIQNSGAQNGIDAGQAASTIASIGSAIGTISGAVGGISDILGGKQSSVGTSSVDMTPGQGEMPVGAKSIEGSVTPQVVQTAVPQGATVDATSPATYRIAPSAPVPPNYMTVGSNSDGSRSIASVPDYKSDLDRFAKFSGVPSSAAVLPRIVSADQQISKAAGLSFIPLQGFQQIAMSSSGRPIFSAPAAASSGDSSLGGDKVINAALAANQLGVDSPAVYDSLGNTALLARSPDFHAQLDSTYAQKGEDGVARQLLDKLGIKGGKDSPAKQEITAGALRVAELWPNLSPAQKSLAISALAPMAVAAKTGKEPSQITIPGTEKTVGGALKVGDAIDVTKSGLNGFALARNWGQLSALPMMLGKNQINPHDAAFIANYAGMLGFGPQGASVPVKPGYLKQVNAMPAPEAGVGAMAFDRDSEVPKNYTKIGTTPTNHTLAMPSNLMHTSTLDKNGPSALGYRKSVEVAGYQHPAQSLWDKKPSKAVRGSAGGSAITSGLGTLLRANPALASAITAHSLFNNTLGRDYAEAA